MATFFVTAGLMGGLMVIMAIGVMMGRDELKGSCGGVAGKDCLCLGFRSAALGQKTSVL